MTPNGLSGFRRWKVGLKDKSVLYIFSLFGKQFVGLTKIFFLQIFDILPVKKASSVPHEVEDSMKCVKVRHKRYISRYYNPDENGAYKVFKVIYTCASLQFLKCMYSLF